jgi:hypothetical protein
VRRAIVALAATLALTLPGFAWACSGTLAHDVVASAWSSGLGH